MGSSLFPSEEAGLRGDLGDQTTPYLEGSIWIHIGNILVRIIPELIINQPYHDLSAIY